MSKPSYGRSALLTALRRRCGQRSTCHEQVEHHEMSEMLMTEVAVGDEVRVHFHPPGPWTSFFEGVVRRVNVTAPEGGFFVVEVGHEVILDREHRVRPGFHDYVRYECRNDFPGRIEILSAAAREVEREAVSDPVGTEPPEE